MKREILFRGKDEKGKWHYGDLVVNKPTQSFRIFSDFANVKHGNFTESGLHECSGELHLVVSETVGQFIGITDKNGSNIFEGDIISNWEFICPLIIGFNNESASFCGSKTNEFETEKCYLFFNDIVMSDGWEIIGSIHDNPELLK